VFGNLDETLSIRARYVMLRRQDFSFNHGEYAVEDVVSVDFSCNSFFADLVAGR
jgi:hypothetical protein